MSFSFLCQARKYVMDSMGARYAEGVILDLEETWKESDPRTPLICFLSMGSDPTDSIIALGKRLKVETRYVSMGQGQEVHARKLLQQTMANVSQGCEVNPTLTSFDGTANQRQYLCYRLTIQQYNRPCFFFPFHTIYHRLMIFKKKFIIDNVTLLLHRVAGPYSRTVIWVWTSWMS